MAEFGQRLLGLGHAGSRKGCGSKSKANAALWGLARATRDIDILIERAEENARRVLAALSGMGFGLPRGWPAEEIVRKCVTIIGDWPRVDMLTVAWSVHYAGPEIRRLRGL